MDYVNLMTYDFREAGSEPIAADDPESLRVKLRFVREHGLAGAMFWEYNADTTGALLRTLFEELRAKSQAPTRTAR